MQGKYQIVTMHDVGHVLQEDDPKQTAEALLKFAQRNRLGQKIVPIRSVLPNQHMPSPQAQSQAQPQDQPQAQAQAQTSTSTPTSTPSSS